MKTRTSHTGQRCHECRPSQALALLHTSGSKGASALPPALDWPSLTSAGAGQELKWLWLQSPPRQERHIKSAFQSRVT